LFGSVCTASSAEKFKARTARLRKGGSPYKCMLLGEAVESFSCFTIEKPECKEWQQWKCDVLNATKYPFTEK
jgi:hypothetical protein